MSVEGAVELFSAAFGQVRRAFGAYSCVQTKDSAIAQTIEPSEDGLAGWSDGGILPGRTLHGIVKQFYSKISKVKPSAKVITIEPAQNALTIECVVKLFSAAFGQVCALRVVDELVCNGLFVFVFCGVCPCCVEALYSQLKQ